MITIALSVISGCDSHAQVRTNSPAGLKRANTNIHTRNQRQAPAPQVSMGALPPIAGMSARRPDAQRPEPLGIEAPKSPSSARYVLGAGDRLGRSVVAQHASPPPPRRLPLMAGPTQSAK